MGSEMCIRDRVEGESNTRNMIYKAWEVIEFLSEIMTLEPGDVISLGSPLLARRKGYNQAMLLKLR